MEPPITAANPTEHSHLPDPSSAPAISPNSPLAAMLESLREQEEERQALAVSLAKSLLQACGSAGATGAGNRAREIAQATVHEALRCAKANSGNKSSTSPHHQGWASVLEDPLMGKDFEVLHFAEDDEGDQWQGGPAWLDGTPQDHELLFSDNENEDNVVHSAGRSGGVIEQQRLQQLQQQQQRPRSKANLRRKGLLSAAFRATERHMEPEWAMVELLERVDGELNPGRGAEQQQQQSSQATLSAIRVLPAPVAGDLFVACAARGHLGVILFYFEEGLPIDHSHSTLKYQAVHAAVEFGHLDAAHLLVSMGAKVDARGGADDRSPLFLAALAKRWDACAWLLEHGASKNIRDKKGLTAYQAMAGSSDPEVAGRSGMLTDPPQRIVSVACRGITPRSLDLTWSEPLRSYEEEVFVGYLVEWRPMRSRSVNPSHSRHVAERVRPPRKGKKKRGRAGWQGAEVRPRSAEEAPTTSDNTLSPTAVFGGDRRGEKGNSTPGAAGAVPPRRPNTGGGETTVDADGCRAEVLPWKTRGVESNTLMLTHLHPATNYIVRVSARTLAGYGVASREAVLRTRVAPPSAPPQPANMVSATPNSITVGWVPPKYENGEPITRYEIQRLVLDQHHPDWEKGWESITNETLTSTTTTTSGSGDINSDDGKSSTANPTTATTNSATTETGPDSSSCFEAPREGGGQDKADASNDAAASHVCGEEAGSAAAAQEAGVALPSVLGGRSGSGSGNRMGDDRKQVGVWIGQSTDKLAPYHTAGGLPTYCRALFRVRAQNLAGWGAWSPSSDALEAQDIILPVKRGATQMLMRWFNKPEGDVLRWELSRRVFRYGTDFRGDDDDSWLICSRNVPGLSGGESTFRVKGLMPGTEYQFRLRAYSNGSWQAKEESVVSSPFKTICSPPDAPHACPRTRQLASDPLVVGGLTDMGALLSAKTAPEIACGGGRNGSDGGGAGRRAAGAGAAAAAAAASAAAIGRGQAQANAECNNEGGMSGLGGVIKRGYNDDDDNDHHHDAAGVCRSSVNSMCKNNDTNDEGPAVEAEVDGEESHKRPTSDGRRGGQRERRQESCTEEEKEEEQKHEARSMGHKHTRRRRLSHHDAEASGQQANVLPALNDKLKHEGDRAEDEKRKEANNDKKGSSAVAAAEESESDAKASTTIVLEWNPGCTNGAITTNYEVWGLAEEIKGQTTGSGEWTRVAVTEAAPTATLTGLREAQPYQFKVRARNGLGWSEFGPPTAPLLLNPLRPCAPPELVGRGVTWLALRCKAPPRAGLVLGFEMQMCRWAPGMSEGEETWDLVVESKGEGGDADLTSSATTTTATASSSNREESRMVWDLRPGAGYRFKARARTVFGWSPGGPASAIYSTARRF